MLEQENRLKVSTDPRDVLYIHYMLFTYLSTLNIGITTTLRIDVIIIMYQVILGAFDTWDLYTLQVNMDMWQQAVL